MAVKSIKQSFSPNQDLQLLMETFKDMVNHCIRIGLENNCSTLKRLSLLSYHELKQYDILSYYKLNAISQACGRLSQMKRDIKKGRNAKSPFVRKLYLVSCYGFKINGMLLSFPVAIKDTVDSVFEVATAPGGAEIENIVTISKIRSMMPKVRVVRLAQRESGLATETIRRVQ